jgi:hypothetical protein
MTIKTHVNAAGSNDALRVRSALKGGLIRRPAWNHNEALRVRSALKGGLIRRAMSNHNATLRSVLSRSHDGKR